ncbi:MULTISPECIES: hypothetical protein [unclassified Pseudonocardia]|uniref:hypothetical protein n=1 Tax=unclassified Pseudonocardia TaxID=2619320 RepID=UPI001ACBF7DF|nr:MULTISPECIES: hypothetical protein [unclassified Pseudonocardia]MBN9101125.1 hypothetical protein [Pseudonocardia sp.]
MTTDDDPGARWRDLPPRIEPQEWVTGRDDAPVPGSIQAADLCERSPERAAQYGG